MIEFVHHLPPVLLRTTLWLTLAAIVVRCTIWAVRPYSPSIHRFAWGLVLAQGLIVATWSLQIPWYEPTGSIQRSAALNGEPLPDFMDLSAAAAANSSADTVPLLEPPVFVPAKRIGTYGQWLMVIWMVGMVLTVGITLSSYALLLMTMRRARAPRLRWYREWKGLLDDHRIEPKIPLLIHQRMGPMLCRLPKSYYVVVPENLWSGLSGEQRLAILRHELAHFQRKDVWKSLAVRMMALPHWFNPVAWWAVRKFDEGAEWACDRTLAASWPRQVPGFARALLEMVEPKSRNVCVTAARGGSLSVRLRRLLSLQNLEDSRMKRTLLITTFLCIAIAGFFRFELVAKEEDSIRTEEPYSDNIMEQQIVDFSAQLPQDEQSLLGRFRQTLQTTTGRIVMQDRAVYFEQMLRQEAQSAALPGFVSEHFEKSGEMFQLRSGQEDFRRQILKASALFSDDLSRIKPAIREIVEKLAVDSDTEKLMARFLNQEFSPTLLYVEGLRDALRPGEAQVKQRLGELFVTNPRGEYFIRESYRDEAEEFLEGGKRALESLPLLRTELGEWVDEMVGIDDLHQQLKQAMGEPSFAVMVAAHFLDHGDENVIHRVNEFFEHLENISEDTGDGLVIVQDHVEEVQEMLSKYQRLSKAAKKLAPSVQAFAEKIRSGKPLEDGWRQLLQSPIAPFRFADEIGLGTSDPKEAVHSMLNQVLAEGDDGKYHLRQDKAEELSDFIRHMFRMHREVRRKGRVIDHLAASLDDPELKEAFEKLSGKFIIAQTLKASLAHQPYDGLAAWIEEHFETSENQPTLREGAYEEIESILMEAEELTRELEKDDF